MSLSGIYGTSVPAEQLQALHILLQSHEALERRAAALCHGSPALAQAWRAWSTLAKLRRQLQMLGRQLIHWREQQLQRERWLRDAKKLLERTQLQGAEHHTLRAAAAIHDYSRANVAHDLTAG